MSSLRVRVLLILTMLALALAPWVQAAGPVSPISDAAPGQTASPRTASHRLIVELQSPPLATWARGQPGLRSSDGRLNLSSSLAQAHLARLQAEQRTFLQALGQAMPGARVSRYLNEDGRQVEAAYTLLWNGLAVDPGAGRDRREATRALLALPGVKAVYPDYAYTPQLYASTELIGAPAAWALPNVGGQAMAGAGVKVASMDGGIHHAAPMFDGAGFDYPADVPPGGLGLAANNNGKIIASRVYFRTWDPPADGDANPWPGTQGTPHGVHTAGIAAGNVVTATYLGLTMPEMSGVAPGAWVMSYRVFYQSISDDPSFYTAEGLAALEDIVRDGADVLNNSWGSGPTSIGGALDPLDQALLNAVDAGIFVSMSIGNAGPGLGSGDHASPGYINVGASTSTHQLLAGRLNVIEPEISEELQGLFFGTANFGANLPPATTVTHPFRASASVDPGNVMGCEPWDAGVFADQAALIQRGTCAFSDKVRNAQAAGAELVLIYNNAGDELLNMGCADDCDDIVIPSIFIAESAGEAMVAWHAEHGDDSVLEIDTLAFTIETVPDRMAAFSSRGPAVGYSLKPDVVAPGVNILSQGYDQTATGEGRHLGFGQGSGTSMAAPHVAGAAAVLRQLYPQWTPAQIKSALMSTAVFRDIYDYDGTPAQPLAIGAGRIDLSRAVDPGVFLDPPSLSFGAEVTGTVRSQVVTVTSIAPFTEMFEISTLYTGAGFTPTQSLPGFAVSPSTIELPPGGTATFVVTMDSATSAGLGDNQGYILLSGTQYEAHLPVWGRLLPEPSTTADILLIDNDGSQLFAFANDYAEYYTSTLEALGYTYDYWDAELLVGHEATIPDATTLSTYKTVIYFSGDNFVPNSALPEVSIPLTDQDVTQLTQYANGGGTLLMMGQDIASILDSDVTDNGEFFYRYILGGNWLQYSVTDETLPWVPVIPMEGAPAALRDVRLSLLPGGDGAANQIYMDEIAPGPGRGPAIDEEMQPYVALFRYPGTDLVDQGVVGMSHRDQPTLERPGITYLGRSIYTTFGLEGVNNDHELTTREELLDLLLTMLWDEPSATIEKVTPPNASGLTMLRAEVASPHDATGESYRWDFGDGSAPRGPYTSDTVGHTFPGCGPYTVRVEVVDAFGNRSLGSLEVWPCPVETVILLPLILH